MPQSDLDQLAQIAASTPTHLRMVLTHIQQERSYRYRRLGLIAGTISFLTCIGSFTYLVMQNHDKAAYTILTATVLGVVTFIFKQKL